MTIPTKIVGAGNDSAAQNVIKVTFSEATSDIPKLMAYDDYNFATTDHEVFGGTVGNGNKSMISAVATTDGAPVASWKPASATPGGATINRLKGATSYVNLSAAALAAGESVMFNLCWEIPSDAAIPSDLFAVFMIEFNYPGAAPIITWEVNDNEDGGSDGTPSWTTLTPGTGGNKVNPADAGSTPANITLHRPPTGVQDIGEVWAV